MEIEGLKTQRERETAIDFISRLNSLGSLSTSQSDNLSGINNQKSKSPSPKNRDSHGYTFFTRPDLNLTSANLAVDRIMTPLMDTSDYSMARAIRCMLDPTNERVGGSPITSAIFDSKQPFLPILTNNLISMSGWPDITVDTYTSKEGVYKESYSMVDGTSQIFNTFDITANFRNIQGDPITLLFTAWVHYASKVYEGVMVPYSRNIVENRIDYQTRIYRLVTDESGTVVTKIAACGAAFPMASPLGASFNYNTDGEFNFENDQVSIPFRCIGVNYMDPILVKEFNQYVAMMNLDMDDKNRNTTMIKISKLLNYENFGRIGVYLSKMLIHKVIPRVDPETMELEWWAYRSDYESAKQDLLEKGII